MSPMAYKKQPQDCLLNRLFRRRSKKISKFCIIGLFEGNSPVTDEFATQRVSNAENVPIWWRHHDHILWVVFPYSWMYPPRMGPFHKEFRSFLLKFCKHSLLLIWDINHQIRSQSWTCQLIIRLLLFQEWDLKCSVIAFILTAWIAWNYIVKSALTCYSYCN